MMPVKTTVVLLFAFEWLDHLMLTAVKATLLFAVIVAFVPLIVCASLRHLGLRRRPGRCGSEEDGYKTRARAACNDVVAHLRALGQAVIAGRAYSDQTWINHPACAALAMFSGLSAKPTNTMSWV